MSSISKKGRGQIWHLGGSLFFHKPHIFVANSFLLTQLATLMACIATLMHGGDCDGEKSGVMPGRTREGKGGPIPQAPNHYGGSESLRGASNNCGGRKEVPTMSQVLPSIQYICFQKTSGSNIGVLNLLLALGAS